MQVTAISMRSSFTHALIFGVSTTFRYRNTWSHYPRAVHKIYKIVLVKLTVRINVMRGRDGYYCFIKASDSNIHAPDMYISV